MTWPSHDLTPQQTSRHQNTSLQSTKHHHHGTAEGSFTAKKWFGHRAGRSPCAHSIGKFFLCYLVLFLLETSAPGLSGHYWYICILYLPFSIEYINYQMICMTWMIPDKLMNSQEIFCNTPVFAKLRHSQYSKLPRLRLWPVVLKHPGRGPWCPSVRDMKFFGSAILPQKVVRFTK